MKFLSRRPIWAILMIAPLAITAAGILFFLPDVVPMHYGPNGIDRYGSRYEMLIVGALLSGGNALFGFMAVHAEGMIRKGFVHGVDDPHIVRLILFGTALFFIGAAVTLVALAAMNAPAQ